MSSGSAESIEASHSVEFPGPSEDLKIFGVGFWNPCYDSFKSWWAQTLASPERKGLRMVTANAYTLNLAFENQAFRQALDRFQVRLNDGIGFKLAAQMRKTKVRYNFNGTDLVPRLLSELEAPLKVFLYGGSEEVSAKVAVLLEERYTHVDVVGRSNGYVESEAELANRIAGSGADLVLIALGHPKQELFAANYGDQLNAKIIYVVGGLFDFLSGAKPRAPKILRMASLEWIYRLAIEPKRMFGRYVVGNPVFLSRAIVRLSADTKAGV